MQEYAIEARVRSRCRDYICVQIRNKCSTVDYVAPCIGLILGRELLDRVHGPVRAKA